MSIDLKGLQQCVAEANTLSSKPNLTKGEERRYNFLLSAISVIKSGSASLSELEFQDNNETRARFQLPTSGLTEKQEQRAKEVRTMLEGDPGARIGTYTGLGFLVPTGFTDRLYSSMGEHDALFDEDACTVIRTQTGAVIPVPLAGDITVEAEIVSENNPRTPTDLASTGHALLGAYTFDSKPWHISMEASQDLNGALSQMNLAEAKFASRLARGIGKKLINGSGSGEPQGILAALTALNVPPVDAIGAENNTGDNSQNNSNSVGLQDVANLIGALDSSYLASDKAAFLMNRATLAFLNGLTSKMGTSVGIVQWVKGRPTICGLPVRISPSMPGISPSSTPILVGDFSYWCTRLVNAGNGNEGIGIKVYRETSNLIEKGVLGISAFTRASGAFLYSGVGGPSPVLALKMGS